MTQRINIERNKAGLEDLLFGIGTKIQSRAGKEVKVTKINAQNLPFDELRSLSQAITDFDEYKTYLAQYDKAITDLQINFQALIKIQEILKTQAAQAEVDTQMAIAAIAAMDKDMSTLTSVNSFKLNGQALSQVRANIDAVSLEGQALSQVRANIDAVSLEGQTLEQIKADINTVSFDDKIQAILNQQNQQNTQIVVLGIEIWGNAIRQHGLQIEGVIL